MDRRSNVAHKARRQRGHVLPDERLMTQRPTADGDAWKERLSDAHLCLSRLVTPSGVLLMPPGEMPSALSSARTADGRVRGE